MGTRMTQIKRISTDFYIERVVNLVTAPQGLNLNNSR